MVTSFSPSSNRHSYCPYFVPTALQGATCDTPVRLSPMLASTRGGKEVLHSLAGYRLSMFTCRDIKPQNVLLISTAADSTVKLADFGSRSAAPPCSAVADVRACLWATDICSISWSDGAAVDLSGSRGT